MSKFLTALMTIILILVGASFILFVIRMIWLSPTPMGMMMGTNMMVHHMSVWFGGTFVFILIIVILLLLVSIFNNKK